MRRGPVNQQRVGVGTTATATQTSQMTPSPSLSLPSSLSDDNQQGMHDRLDALTEQVHQQARGRCIRNITQTNTIRTVYEEPGGGGATTVRRTSTRTGPGRQTRSNQSGSGPFTCKGRKTCLEKFHSGYYAKKGIKPGIL